MKKSELRQLIKELVLEQARVNRGPMAKPPTRPPMRGDMSEICAAAAQLDRMQSMGGPDGPKAFKLWQRFKHAIRHILGLEDSCPNGGGSGVSGEDPYGGTPDDPTFYLQESRAAKRLKRKRK